jgi:hypothetical protein
MSNTILYVIIGISVVIILYILTRNKKEGYNLKSDDNKCTTITIRYLNDSNDTMFNSNWIGVSDYTPCGSDTVKYDAVGEYLPNHSGARFKVKPGTRFQYKPMGVNTGTPLIDIKSVPSSSNLNYLAMGALWLCKGECTDDIEGRNHQYILDGAQVMPCDDKLLCRGDLNTHVKNRIGEGSYSGQCSCSNV